jgi:RNA polymerase sigma-70 factor (ECF subfamily)
MVISDAQLVEQVRLGDIEAFGKLAERYERTLLAIAIGTLHDFHTAEDVVQAALLLAFRRLKTLRDGEKFGAWLVQIARSQVVETVRSRPAPAAVRLASEHQTGHEDKIDSWIEWEHVRSLVDQLSDDERVLIGLRYFDGHSMAQTAAITGRPIGTITKQISRAVCRLRTWWEKENAR